MNPAPTSQLVDWVQKWAGQLEINHLETPPHDHLAGAEGFRFFHTRLLFRDHIFRGNGSDKDPELALLKSIAEAIERAVSIGAHGLQNSTGTAAHFSIELAKVAARNELLERDSFFTHFLTQTPFQKTSSSEFYQMQCLEPGLVSALCRICLPIRGKIRSIISAAAGSNFEEAREKSFSEGLSLANTLLHTDPGTANLTNLTEFTPWDHIRLIFSPEHSDWFEKNFFSSSGTIPSLTKRSLITFEEFDLKGLPFEDCGLHIVRAISPDLQEAYWGLPKEEKINFNRLRLLKPDITKTDIPWNHFHLFG